MAAILPPGASSWHHPMHFLSSGRHHLPPPPPIVWLRVDKTGIGVSGCEGASNRCTFWFSDVLASAGRTAGSVRSSCRGDGTSQRSRAPSSRARCESGRGPGSYPQASTHVGLIFSTYIPGRAMSPRQTGFVEPGAGVVAITARAVSGASDRYRPVTSSLRFIIRASGAGPRCCSTTSSSCSSPSSPS